jgi:hypothetical protein
MFIEESNSCMLLRNDETHPSNADAMMVLDLRCPDRASNVLKV